MLDAVLADELRRTLAVARIDAHDAGRQGLAELTALVLEFQKHGGLQLLPDLAVAVPVVVLVAGQQVLAAYRHGSRREQCQLLGLVVGNRGRPLEAVEVVIHQRFLRRFGCLGTRRRGHRVGHLGLRRPHPVHRAGHQLQRRVVETGAAAVGQRDPAVEVEALALGRQVGDVVGLPRQTGCKVGQFDRLLAATGVEQDRERRPVAQVGRHAVESQPSRHTGFDAVRKAQYRALSRSQHRGTLAFFAVIGRMRTDHRHLAADVLFQQLLRRQQVEVEILLDQAQRLAAHRTQQCGFGPHLRRHFAQREAIQAGGQVDLAALLDQRQIVVVDGDRDGLAIGGGRHDIAHRLRGMAQACDKKCSQSQYANLHEMLPMFDGSTIARLPGRYDWRRTTKPEETNE